MVLVQIKREQEKVLTTKREETYRKTNKNMTTYLLRVLKTQAYEENIT